MGNSACRGPVLHWAPLQVLSHSQQSSAIVEFYPPHLTDEKEEVQVTFLGR